MSASGRFAIVPARAVEDQRLGNAALRVLCCLGTYADKDGWCRPSMRTMSERVGLTRPTIIEHIQQLGRLGYVETKRRERPDGGCAANEYRLLFDRGLFAVQTRLQGAADQPALPLSDHPTPPVGPSDTPLSGQPTPHVGSGPTPKIKERPNRTTLSRSVPDLDTARQFETFWQAYPHRDGDPKKPALKLFAAAVRRSADPEAIIRGARNYAATMRANGTERRFLAQAKTWLNEERWNQHQEAPHSTGTGGFSYGHNT